MSKEYCAALVVGVAMREQSDNERERLRELVDDDDIQDFPPAYDRGLEGVVGILVVDTGPYSPKELDPDVLDTAMEAAHNTFTNLTGLVGNLYITPVGY